MPKIAILLGSARTPGNGKGLASWLTRILDDQLNSQASSNPDSNTKFQLVLVDQSTPPHPLGPITDGTRIPAEIRDPAQYPSAATREWSSFISSCAAIVVLTPQYNWGVPGELKNAFDHLYWEWRDKPAVIVTYGGHGGSKCAEQLRSILGGGLNMQLVQTGVQITLPGEFITGSERVPVNGPEPEFLKQYEAAVQQATGELKLLLSATS